MRCVEFKDAQLLRRLRRSDVVSLTARASRAAVDRAVPRRGTIRLATGAADLAYATGAALLPVFAVRELEEHFRAVIDPPLEVRHQVARREFSDVAGARLPGSRPGMTKEVT